MKRSRQKNQGSILVIAIIGAGIGSFIVGTLLNFAIQDFSSMEKEIGHAKSAQALKLAHLIYTESVNTYNKEKETDLTNQQRTDLSKLIGGDKKSVSASIFGNSSAIPSFNQFNVIWDGVDTGKLSKITSTHTGKGTNAFQEGSKAVLSVTTALPSPPLSFFGMLAFYKGDWEIVPQYRRTHLLGNIYSDGNIYLDCFASHGGGASSGEDLEKEKIVFHALQNTSSLTTDKTVFRRGRNGQTLYYYKESDSDSEYELPYLYKGGTQNKNVGLKFSVYVDSVFKNLLTGFDNYRGNYYENWRGLNHHNSANIVFDEYLTSEYTNYESIIPPPGDSHSDDSSEAMKRRFAGEGDDFGYVYTGLGKINGEKFDAPGTSGSPVSVIKFGTGDGKNTLVNFTANMVPYQLLEDLQYEDTQETIDPNTIGYPGLPSNYSEDSANVLKTHALNALAPIVIRDGTGYWRDAPAVKLRHIRCINGTDPKVRYPNPGTFGSYDKDNEKKFNGFYGTLKSSHPKQTAIYGDLRWYGHFGQDNTPPIPASESNPDRWHFPIRSVTFNNQSSGGPNVNFSDATASKWYPTKQGFHLPSPWYDTARWIVTNNDLSDLPGYPPFNESAATNTNTGAGIGMFNNTYPVMSDGGGVEKYDPVRVAYNVVKAEVRKLYNADHMYTSRHNGKVMLNANGTIPAANTAPDVWGPNVPDFGVDFDGVAGKDYSAFWNDDGAKTSTGNFLYSFQRDQTAPTEAINGELFPDTTRPDKTPKVELFPIRHKSLSSVTSPKSNMNDWFIYKSTLPFSDRTLPMPKDRNHLDGWDWSINKPLVNNDSEIARTENFGFAGATIGGKKGYGDFIHYKNSTLDNTGFHNWYTLLNNAPEMLARRAHGEGGITFERDFSYNASDTGGYYGIDNLCMIDNQEKKIVVFTEIDLGELTKEAFNFNNLPNFEGPSNIITGTKLQKIIYVVNTTMGKNFFGKRVHCGAVRIIRGDRLSHPLTIATPNALHVWGDFNYPGYVHHGRSNATNSEIFYKVPTSKEHDPNTKIISQPAALYADSIHAYPNNWIPFDQDAPPLDGYTYRSIDDQGAGALKHHDNQNSNRWNYFDTRLWWEDDGVRGKLKLNYRIHADQYIDYDLDDKESTDAPIAMGQRFLNYHELIFDHAANDYYAKDSAWTDRNEQNSIGKLAPQVIYAGLVYGNVTSRLPSIFSKKDINTISSNQRPSSVPQLDWMMSWIPRSQWTELTRDQMRNDASNTLTNGGLQLDPSIYDNINLSLNNYYGTNFVAQFPGTAEWQFEECKIKFSGGGFSRDIRYHLNQDYIASHYDCTTPGMQQNVFGSSVCLFESRQATHGWNPTVIGSKTQELCYSYYVYDENTSTYAPFKSDPPGTPKNTGSSGSGTSTYKIEGTRWNY